MYLSPFNNAKPKTTPSAAYNINNNFNKTLFLTQNTAIWKHVIIILITIIAIKDFAITSAADVAATDIKTLNKSLYKAQRKGNKK